MHKYKILETPDHIKSWRGDNKEFTQIDYGIIKTLKWLWKNEIITEGSCLGKGCGRNCKDRPNIVLPQEYTNNDIKKIVKLIKQVDKRDWMIMQWRNVEVGKQKPKRPFFRGIDKL